jgi:hypothetical protein
MNVQCWKCSKNNQQATIKLSRNFKPVHFNQVINRQAIVRHLDLQFSGDETRTVLGKCNVLLHKAPNEAKFLMKRSSTFGIGVIKSKTTSSTPCMVYSEPLLKQSKIYYCKENSEESCQISVFPVEIPNMALSLTANIQKSEGLVKWKRLTCYDKKDTFKYRVCFIDPNTKSEFT